MVMDQWIERMSRQQKIVQLVQFRTIVVSNDRFDALTTLVEHYQTMRIQKMEVMDPIDWAKLRRVHDTNVSVFTLNPERT